MDGAVEDRARRLVTLGEDRARRAAARRRRRPGGRAAHVEECKPHIVFNLMEAFHELGTFDHNVVSYLELLRVPYTGCNPRGLMLARDKALVEDDPALPPHPGPRLRGRSRRPEGSAAEAAGLSGHRQVADAGSIDRHLAGVGRGRRGASSPSGCGSFTRASAPTRSSSTTSKAASSTSGSSATSA